MSKLMFSFDGQRIHVDPNHGLTKVQLINTLSEIIEASRERANELIAELIDETTVDVEALNLLKNMQ
ncbi:hypothetical protein AncyloWKF20_14225 [Ancylobacter sp. WKF20]|uniref:hypothetical protein n=1 Tax=Ancylobacter sp. WKF20 TaxID=3039801 RepID=UPI0024341320|nr:hypothetical protein [Ancylobacter sp. WKF20]WGD28938.1 hypothetical protein AncyloWKF20_14225 [Ancylobacter sp. WKF20]